VVKLSAHLHIVFKVVHLDCRRQKNDIFSKIC
jgi:hypothetical protein